MSQTHLSLAVPWSPKGDQEVEENEDVGARKQFPPTGTMGAIVLLTQQLLSRSIK